MKFTEYQLAKQWTELSINNYEGHGWRVIEGRFGGVCAVYDTKEECEEFLNEYRKAQGEINA